VRHGNRVRASNRDVESSLHAPDPHTLKSLIHGQDISHFPAVRQSTVSRSGDFPAVPRLLKKELYSIMEGICVVIYHKANGKGVYDLFRISVPHD
jgi:hypothetical protein